MSVDDKTYLPLAGNEARAVGTKGRQAPRRTKSKNFAFFGNFDSGNFGYEAPFRASLYHVCRFHPDAYVTFIFSGPDATRASYHVKPTQLAEILEKSWRPKHPVSKLLRTKCVAFRGESLPVGQIHDDTPADRHVHRSWGQVASESSSSPHLPNTRAGGPS